MYYFLEKIGVDNETIQDACLLYVTEEQKDDKKIQQVKNYHLLYKKAGVQGFEPQLADPESAVLPLNDTPSRLVRCEMYHTASVTCCQAFFCRGSSIFRCQRNKTAYLRVILYD